MTYDLGIVVGKFAPLTIGHINLITQASLQAKKVVVVLSHDSRWLERQPEPMKTVLNFKNRLRWLMQTYADVGHVDIRYVLEDGIPEFPNGWSEYCDRLRDVYKDVLSKERSELTNNERVAPTVAIFSSELEYDQGYRTYLPEVSHVVVDANRTLVPISATQIRNDVYSNWEYLPSIVRKAFTKRVVIIGQESAGKTTLVKNLAKMFNTSWVEEYGRTYCEQDLVGDETTLNTDDYPIIAYRQKALEEDAIRVANRVCLIDTNAFITEYYHRLYEGKPNDIVTAMAHAEHYDLVIILEPTVPWVDDGLRTNSDRTKTTELFESMLKEFPNQTPDSKTYRIFASDFKTRFDEAYGVITKFLKNNGVLNGRDE